MEPTSDTVLTDTVLTDTALTDTVLVRAALLGDKEALGALIQRHWQMAVFLAARVLGSPDLARDAVQEAAIAAMTGLDRLRSPDKFGAWFCGVTLNVSRRWLRQAAIELPGLDAEPAAQVPGPDEAAELAEIATRVRGAIALLAAGQAEAVRLFYLQGLSHREVASELCISPGAVKARLHQARAALAPKLAEVADLTERKTMTTADSQQRPDWVDAEITEIRLHQADDEQGHHIMILTETGGGRRLPIWIGPGEAAALALTIEATETPRPFTYQLASSLVSAAGAEIKEVRITRLQPPIFYATVIVEGAAGQREVDARPSDAVNLAAAAGVPIRVDSILFDIGIHPDYGSDYTDYPVITADLAESVSKRFHSLSQEPPEA